MTPEGRVKALVKHRLPVALPGVYLFWPVQAGMGAPALDLIGCYRGIYFSIETKVPGKDMTDRQKHTRDQILAAGGLVFLVRDKDDLERAILAIQYRAWRWIPTPKEGLTDA